MPKYCVHAGGEVQVLDCEYSVDQTGCLHLDLLFREAVYNVDDWSVVHPLYVKVKGCPNAPAKEEKCSDDTVPLLS